MSLIALPEYQSEEESIFKQVLIGQSLRHNCALKMLIGSYWEGYCVHDLGLSRVIGSTYDAVKIISDEMDKRFIKKFYIDCSSNNMFKGDYYELINRITRSDLFLLVSFNEDDKKSLNDLGFQEIEYEKIETVYDFTSDIIYIQPDRLNNLIDIAIYKKIMVTFERFSFSNCVKKLLKNVKSEEVKKEINDKAFMKKFYGFSEILKFDFCGSKIEIPLEMFIMGSSSSYGYMCVLGDISYNYAVMLYLDNIQKRKERIVNIRPLMTSKRLITFIMSDGDNVSFMAGKLSRCLDVKRDYPLTWTISNLSPLAYYNNMLNKANEYDTFISAGYGYPDVNPNLTKMIVNEKISNVIEGNFLSLIKKNDYVKNIDSEVVLLYHILNYSLNRKPFFINKTLVLSANHQIVFEKDIQNLIDKINNQDSNEPLIVALNINFMTMGKINDLVSRIKDKVEIISLQQMISEMKFMNKIKQN